jgi:hypothetical protein
MKCPLCDKILLEIGSNPTEFICQTRVRYNKADLPHYSKRDSDSIIWYLPPYKIINKDETSEIWVVVPGSETQTYWAPDFNFIAKVPVIHPDKPEIVTKRIKKLVLFS